MNPVCENEHNIITIDQFNINNLIVQPIEVKVDPHTSSLYGSIPIKYDYGNKVDSLVIEFPENEEQIQQFGESIKGITAFFTHNR